MQHSLHFITHPLLIWAVHSFNTYTHLYNVPNTYPINNDHPISGGCWALESYFDFLFFFTMFTGHQPLNENASIAVCVCWNYDKVLAILHKYSCVLAYFAGHDHDGGYAQDEYGIHHVTVQAGLEGDVGQCDFGTVHVFEDRLVLNGSGRVPDRTFKLPQF